jgi:hypothetical protein
MTEFINEVRKQFQYLSSVYQFNEVSSKKFEINYESSTTSIRIEGINWGLNSRVAIGSKYGQFENYDLADVIFGCSRVRVKVNPNINQLKQIEVLATLLLTYAKPVLNGEHSSFTEANRQIELRSELFRVNRGKGI